MHERHWNVRRLVRVGPYAAPLRDMLISLKYHGEHRTAVACGRGLAAAIKTEPWSSEIDLFVPVPMHYWRRLQRPCNHADALAEVVSRLLQIPLRRAAVHRPTYAPSQTQARSRAERFEHVKGSFAPTRKPGVSGKRVCIIDNVVVTGATLHEVSKVLRKSGASKVFAAVFARAPMPGDLRFINPKAANAGSDPAA
jgi:ComF family protein